MRSGKNTTRGRTEEDRMVRTKDIAWWLAPAILVMLFDAWLAIHELIGGSLLGDTDPRAEIRFGAAGVWLALAVATAAGLVLRRRRPGLAGGLIIVGSLPAAMLVWSPTVMVAGLASCTGAFYHIAHTGARVDRRQETTIEPSIPPA
jgi:hypothetical protein